MNNNNNDSGAKIGVLIAWARCEKCGKTEMYVYTQSGCRNARAHARELVNDLTVSTKHAA